MITRTRSAIASTMVTLALISTVDTSCKKELSQASSTSQTNSSTIAVAASENTAASGDSIYVIQPCPRGYSRDSIAESALPSAAAAYLSDNYSGYSFVKAFAVVNTSGQTAAYVAIIYFNDKPVAILFDAAGDFVRVLEQRDRGDIDGKGWHDGGRFCDRDGRGRDTVALSSLSNSILSFMLANYPGDTLVKAFQNRDDSGFLVISKNNGLFATVFNAGGNFVKRLSLPAPPGICVSTGQGDLPRNVMSYLGTTYPAYVFEKAFAAYNNNTELLVYVVVINANNTKYAVRFDASGNFVSARSIW